MIDYEDILKQSKNVQRSVPEGYFNTLEERIHAAIKPESKRNPAFAALKPALALACTFALIFGIGYGALSLTSTLDRSTAIATDGSWQTEEVTASLQHLIYLGEQLEEEELEEISDEAILEYLNSSNTGSSYMYYYALASIE